MGFIEYTKPPRMRSGGSPFISVNSTGLIRFSKVAEEKYLGDATRIVFYFDSDTKRFAMKPVHQEMLNVFNIVRTNNNCKISAASFFNEVGIPLPDKTIRYDCEWNDELGAMVVDPSTGS